MNSNFKKDVTIRLTIVLACYSFWVIYRVFILQDDNTKPIWNFNYCFDDKVLTYFLADFTNFLSQNLFARDLLIITASGVLDIFMVTFLILFIYQNTSWRPVIHIIIFYAFRGAVVQSLIFLEYY